jgi:hypothetical protein
LLFWSGLVIKVLCTYLTTIFPDSHPEVLSNLYKPSPSKIVGPGTAIFGAGPDGAREATFEGRMDYPSAAAPWAGYLVVQAKFLQRPLGTGKDGSWALAQLEADLKKFVARKRRLRRPEYYIFCTNVVLSPGHLLGGRDRADALFKKYERQLPLKGHAIWPRWTSENRPYVDTSKPANGAEPGQE